LKSKYERDQNELNNKLLKERLTNMLNASGQKVNLIYTYQGKTTVIPMPGIEFNIGRAPQNDLVLDLPFVSKSHLVLSYSEDGKFYVKDLRSTNGTLLNNVRFHDKVGINNGDIISIGMVDIKFSQVK
jgi:pSer/pThr/pTyr-binding forkhead associated (FHA) protein